MPGRVSGVFEEEVTLQIDSFLGLVADFGWISRYHVREGSRS